MHVKQGENGETPQGQYRAKPQKGNLMRGKPLVLKRTDDGCIVPTSHKLNKDGYFRYRDSKNSKKGRKPLIMYHRLVWREVYGEIPKGYEIDHICKNRACCNIDHLQMLKREEHLKKDNHLRYKARKDKAKQYWQETSCTGTELAKVFGVSYSAGCRWIREWKV